MLMTPRRTLLALFAAQVLLCVFGTQIFVVRVNPIALTLISVALSWKSLQFLKDSAPPASVSNPKTAALYASFALLGVLLAAIPLNALWLSWPDPGKHSDVLPQLQGQADLFWQGVFPYQRIPVEGNHPFPVYMPLHWGPFLLHNLTGIDVRWPSFLMLVAGIWVATYSLIRRVSIPFDYLTALMIAGIWAVPLWAFIHWSKSELAISAEGIVTAWYLILAAGLVSRHHGWIIAGMIGGLLSRYTFLFWLPLLAALLWEYAPLKRSFQVWGISALAVIVLFILPFLSKDPSILASMQTHYNGCSESSWVRPDDYTFRDGLGMNIHLREWLGGTPASNFPYRHWPQFFIQLGVAAAAWWYYRKAAHRHFHIYDFSLLLLALMPMLFYLFSPMLFRYYMLLPLYLSAFVMVWALISERKAEGTGV